ncbi:MAG: glycosyltransferase family 2 protein, partial [Candidatus Heimdallarchaeaceae archaeon]
NIRPLYTELKEVLISNSYDYEIIFIDDGSTDNTLIELKSIIEEGEKNVRAIQLRKHFGKSAALTAGFQNTYGNIIVSLDGDGQDNPHDIPLLLKALSNDVDIVCGWRYNRHDSFFKKVPSKIYNFLNRLFNRMKIHDSGCTLRAYRKEAVDELLLLDGDHRYLPAILRSKGFRLTEMKVNHRARFGGKSKYGYKRLFIGLSDLFTLRFLFRYGKQPIRLFIKIGFFCFITTLALAIYLLVQKYAYNQVIGFHPALLLTILFCVSGIHFLLTGIISEIIVRRNISSNSIFSIKKIH